MRKLGITLAVVAGVFLLATPAWANGTINWTGNGADNLPCVSGAHWVLAPAFGISSATLYVRYESNEPVAYVMVQSGNGSWSADSDFAIADGVEAYVVYTGPGDERDHLQLSHCLNGSPSPTTTPPPTSPPPSTTTTPPPTSPPTTTSKPPTHEPSTHTPTTSSIRPTAMTGFGAKGVTYGAVGLLLAFVGTFALRYGSKRA